MYIFTYVIFNYTFIYVVRCPLSKEGTSAACCCEWKGEEEGRGKGGGSLLFVGNEAPHKKAECCHYTIYTLTNLSFSFATMED